MEEYIADLMSYEQLQKKVIKNEEAIQRFSKTVGDSSVGSVVPDRSRQLRGSAGTVTLYNESSGLKLDTTNDNRLCIASATTADIDEGISVNKPIVPATIKYAIQSKAYHKHLSSITSVDHEDAKTPPDSYWTKRYVDDKTKTYTGDFSDVKDTPKYQGMIPAASAVKNLVLANIMNFKMATIAKGETFTITPGMLALILPYGDYTLSAHKADGTEIATGMGTTMIFSAERDEAYDGDYWMAAVYARSAMLTATVSSNHNRYSTDCYIKNNYSGNEGSGMAYVYYLS
jgi:hypothetical protein